MSDVTQMLGWRCAHVTLSSYPEGGRRSPGLEGGNSVMATLLLALLADIVFESAATRRRAFTQEMDRYFEKRGLVPTPKPIRTR